MTTLYVVDGLNPLNVATVGPYVANVSYAECVGYIDTIVLDLLLHSNKMRTLVSVTSPITGPINNIFTADIYDSKHNLQSCIFLG
jgi:hypothetical protein